MKVLVFGGEGFVGVALQKILAENKIDFTSVSRRSEISVDISNDSDFDKLQSSYYDVVVNCATVLPGGTFLDSQYLDKIYRTNILGSQNICRWIAEQEHPPRVINLSTLVVNKKPWADNLDEGPLEVPSGQHTLYTSSKLFQEAIFDTLALMHQVSVVQLRLAAVYGLGMSESGIMYNLITAATEGVPIQLTNGNKVSFDFIHVRDVGQIIYKFIMNDGEGTFNVASGSAVTLNDLAELIIMKTESTSVINNIDFPEAVADFANVSVSKLKLYYPVEKILPLEAGIEELLS